MILWARAILFGWVALLGIAYGVEGPLLSLTAPVLGVEWTATVHLMFDCLTLTAAGFAAGRWSRPRSIPAALVFAATLSFWDFGEAVALNVPWLARLIWDSLHDSRFIDSLIASVETQVLLFGCLVAGAGLSRAREKPVSILS